jgi:hypothetical protein
MLHKKLKEYGMKRFTLLLLITIVGALLCTACGGKSETPQYDPSRDRAEEAFRELDSL